ncbi:hypothetical protein [Frankia sp. AgKG'84/4]|uniref:hypothetical protein n=1 Tax=Frankia sp. AgKG'84/4 TaxID=573490 RepID=UPI0020108A83|nr:hypothetical protein [Frankia sp. AgKG'84/4]MCL9793301.1 hypothetical protein [Frankia sp. AgKG'84/4]
MVLRKSLVSVSIGGLTWLVANATGQQKEWGLLFSAFVGAVVLMVQFLIDFERRIATMESSINTHHIEIEALVQRRFAEISEIAELFSLVEASAMRTDVVVQFLRNAVAISDAPRLRFELAHAEIGRMSEFLHELQSGHATYFGEDRDWLLGLTREAEHSVDAISLPSVDGGVHGFAEGFWESDLGHRYLECQREAIDRRDVSVRRIIVLERGNPRAVESVFELCALHASYGIEVRTLHTDAIPLGISRALLDFIIFDDVVGYEVTPGAHAGADRPPTIVNTRLVLRSDVVRAHRVHFDELWGTADPFDPSTAVARAPLRAPGWAGSGT